MSLFAVQKQPDNQKKRRDLTGGETKVYDDDDDDDDWWWFTLQPSRPFLKVIQGHIVDITKCYKRQNISHATQTAANRK